jgi:uridylate kinase
MKKTVVMSLGGSLIVPGKVDTRFLRDFVALIQSYVRKGHRFAIICGGGKIAREYQQAALSIAKLNNEALDWIGIGATHLNAQLLRELFGDSAHAELIKDPMNPPKSSKSVIISPGWKPGWSTDFDAVLIAKKLGAKTLINMSNVEFVYSTDPRKDRSAKPMPKISWAEYRKMAGNTWKAGLNLPFDPIAAKEAQRGKMGVYIIGKDLKNFRKVLDGASFKGTVIS